MPTCCAFGCENATKPKPQDQSLHFYSIPTGHNPSSRHRRHLWVQAINREDLTDEKLKHARLCSAHFISGKRSEDPNNPDFVPSIFCFIKKAAEVHEQKVTRYGRYKRRADDHETAYIKTMKKIKSHLNADAGSGNAGTGSNTTEISSDSGRDPVSDEINKLHLENERLRNENLRLQSENKKLQEENKLLKHHSKFGFHHLKDDEKLVRFYTGLSSLNTFLWLVSLCQFRLPLVRKSLSWEDHLLLVLMKIRLGCLNTDLSYRFTVPIQKLSSLFDIWIPGVSGFMKHLITWPTRLAVRQNLPACFKKFMNCRCVVDCTEIFIARPTDYTIRSQTWSSYKHNNTIKYLIGMTPAGAVSFLSPGAGGRMSDKQLTINSGFLEMIQSGDEILADRGFLVSHEVACRGGKLIFPSFTKGKKQLSKREVDVSRLISSARIHIERVIRAIKKNRILQSTIQISQVKFLDDIMIICCAVTNLNRSVVPPPV